MWLLDGLEKCRTMDEVQAYIDRSKAARSETWAARRETFTRWSDALQNGGRFFAFEHERQSRHESGYLIINHGHLVLREVMTSSTID